MGDDVFFTHLSVYWSIPEGEWEQRHVREEVADGTTGRDGQAEEATRLSDVFPFQLEMDEWLLLLPPPWLISSCLCQLYWSTSDKKAQKRSDDELTKPLDETTSGSHTHGDGADITHRSGGHVDVTNIGSQLRRRRLRFESETLIAAHASVN